MAASNTQTTTLTATVTVTSTYKADANNTTAVVFNYLNNTLWSTVVNNTASIASLNGDAASGNVVIHSKATVTEQIPGGMVNILFTGTITDGQNTYTFNNTQIASFAM